MMVKRYASMLLIIIFCVHLIFGDNNTPTYHIDNNAQMIRLSPISPKSAPMLSNFQQVPNNKISNKLTMQLDVGFMHAFIASLSVIIVSELGDKTFFIAAILSMRHKRSTVFLGSLSALVLMTILSAFLGYATTIIPHWFTYYVSCALFAVFGLKMLREGYMMEAGEAQEEYEEVKRELGSKEQESNLQSDVEAGVKRTIQPKMFLHSFFSKVFLQSFMLTFLAEWGDRSQIATIILAARDEVVGVVIGGVLGHALCTFLAVVGGRFIAQHISLKTVHFIGGIVFLIFALSAFFIKPEDH